MLFYSVTQDSLNGSESTTARRATMARVIAPNTENTQRRINGVHPIFLQPKRLVVLRVTTLEYTSDHDQPIVDKHRTGMVLDRTKSSETESIRLPNPRILVFSNDAKTVLLQVFMPPWLTDLRYIFKIVLSPPLAVNESLLHVQSARMAQSFSNKETCTGGLRAIASNIDMVISTFGLGSYHRDAVLRYKSEGTLLPQVHQSAMQGKICVVDQRSRFCVRCSRRCSILSPTRTNCAVVVPPFGTFATPQHCIHVERIFWYNIQHISNNLICSGK